MEIVIESEQQTLESKCEEFLELGSRIKTLQSDLRDISATSTTYQRILELRKKIKLLHEEYNDNEEVKSRKDKIAVLKERKGLLEEIIILDMKQQQLSLFDMDSGKLKINTKSKLKYEKEKKA